ncbi:MAG: type I-C CRISPR-associated endonuclease Cas1c [Proteobacteria bacterium]|nr:type I-C CRISPR-associated endonuclease Cas1c [Pseudomonadota bacterium]
MKKMLNTLFVTTQGTYLKKEGETVVIRQEKQDRARFPIHTLSGIVCFGNVSASPFLLGFCAERGVSVSFLSQRGRFLARVTGPVSGNVLLRRAQYRLADDPEGSARVARFILAGKLSNSRAVLGRALRDHSDKMDGMAVKEASGRISGCLELTMGNEDLNVLRGLEGEAARTYFSVFDHLIVRSKKDFRFTCRSRRPPLDPVNALLSFFYSLLLHDIRSALESVGLDPAVGFLHRDRPGRYGLALDLMEEFRPVLADRLALSLINLGQVKGSDFREIETGGVLMTDEARKRVLVAWQTRKQEEMMHPFLKEKAPLGMFFWIQAALMARFLRGDLDGYPPFLWR